MKCELLDVVRCVWTSGQATLPVHLHPVWPSASYWNYSSQLQPKAWAWMGMVDRHERATTRKHVACSCKLQDTSRVWRLNSHPAAFTSSVALSQQPTTGRRSRDEPARPDSFPTANDKWRTRGYSSHVPSPGPGVRFQRRQHHDCVSSRLRKDFHLRARINLHLQRCPVTVDGWPLHQVEVINELLAK